MVNPEKRSFFHFGKKDRQVAKPGELPNKSEPVSLEDPRLDRMIADELPKNRGEFTHKPRHKKRK
jgi:hypothetical protein